MLELKPLGPEELEDLKPRYDAVNYKLVVVKNRDGRAGDSIPLNFDKATQRFRQSNGKEEA